MTSPEIIMVINCIMLVFFTVDTLLSDLLSFLLGKRKFSVLREGNYAVSS